MRTFTDYLKNCRSINALDTDRKGKPYNDDLCFFRCLVKFFKQKLNKENVKTYYNQWCDFTNVEIPMKKFGGVELCDIPEVEDCFKININIFERQADKTVTPVYKSQHIHKSTMYLNMHKNHLSYVKKFNSYAKKFHCPTCDRHFNHQGLIRRHLRTCSNVTKYKFPGGFFEKSKSVFDELEAIGIITAKADQLYPWFITFDFEAMIQKINLQPTDKLKWIEKHVPISVSVSSNVPRFTSPKFIDNANLDKLLEEMISYMNEIGEKTENLAKSKWHDVLEQLKVLREEFEGEDEDDDPSTFAKKVKTLTGNFLLYCKQISVTAFNSAKYDLNLVKAKLAKHLNLDTAEKPFTVKKNNAYMCISNDQFKFLDICQYLAPGSSYSKFLVAFQIEEKKSYFPYQWFDHVDKLNYTELPPYEAFHSDLKKGNVLALDLQNWDGKGEKT